MVVASILQNRSSLALGNVVGSSISNILGAFSLGLLFHPGRLEFDRSAKVYTALQFFVTTGFAIAALTNSLGWLAGVILIGVFVLYVVSVSYTIYKGVLDPPEDSESDDSDDDISSRSASAVVQHNNFPTETSSLLPPSTDEENSARHWNHSLLYHIVQLALGFMALSLSGYVISHSAASIADSFNLSGTVLGITVLSFATTLPEKLVAVIGGARGHGGIVVASTAGSNIFLLTLCLGITLVVGSQEEEFVQSLIPFELFVVWASSALFSLIVLFGSSRWIGGVLLMFYAAFIVLEFTIYRR